MDNQIMKYHDFERAKNRIKNFSEQMPPDLGLKKVSSEDSFLFWSYEHAVTGKELNELTTQIQTNLRNIKDTQVNLTKEFGEIYNAFEYLDKDYIKGILSSVKATEETSQKIQENQEKIKQIVDNQEKILKKLLNLKEINNETIESQANILHELIDFKQEMGDYAKFNDIVFLTEQIKRTQVIAFGAAGVAIIAVILILMKVS